LIVLANLLIWQSNEYGGRVLIVFIVTDLRIIFPHQQQPATLFLFKTVTHRGQIHSN